MTQISFAPSDFFRYYLRYKNNFFWSALNFTLGWLAVTKQSARRRFRKLPCHVFILQTTSHVEPSAYDPRHLNEQFQLISFKRMDNFSEQMTKSFERMQIILNGCHRHSNGWTIFLNGWHRQNH